MLRVHTRGCVPAQDAVCRIVLPRRRRGRAKRRRHPPPTHCQRAAGPHTNLLIPASASRHEVPHGLLQRRDPLRDRPRVRRALPGHPGVLHRHPHPAQLDPRHVRRGRGQGRVPARRGLLAGRRAQVLHAAVPGPALRLGGPQARARVLARGLGGFVRTARCVVPAPSRCATDALARTGM
jgi:hypothetical protein